MSVEVSLGNRVLKRLVGQLSPGLMLALALLGLLSASALAVQPDLTLETEPFFKPLVDTTQHQPLEAQPLKPLEGRAEKQGEIPISNASTPIITGKVQTLQQAIDSERDGVDWYAWYMAARTYIGKTGGLRCALGTPIKFYRSGKMEALTFDTGCIASVMGRRFPLPSSTTLDALILPVRAGQGPPATRDEIYSRIRMKSE
ncbi:hypothetical protein [Vampirovibrio sp.]|uniref:hypothetical protein n=1 Tax=Vampirovibrio sp. TaxID=2717857 RepID=UPI003593E6A3